MTPQILNLSNFSLDELRTIQKQIEEKLVEERQAFTQKKIDTVFTNIGRHKNELTLILKSISDTMDEAFDDPDLCDIVEFECYTPFGILFYNQAGFDVK